MVHTFPRKITIDDTQGGVVAVESVNALVTMGWPATAAILGTIGMLAGFGLAVLKYLSSVKKQEPEPIPGPDINLLKEEVSAIQNEIKRLQQELDHLRESLTAKDDNVVKQIEEMKATINKLTDMLIKLLSQV